MPAGAPCRPGHRSPGALVPGSVAGPAAGRGPGTAVARRRPRRRAAAGALVVQRWTWRHGCPREGNTPTCGRRRAGDCPKRHDGGLRLVEPKTRTSRRTLVLPPPLTDELRRHRVALAERRLAAGPSWVAEPDLVFPAPAGGLIDPRRDNAEWNRLLREAGVRRVRLHDARHTAATLLLVRSRPDPAGRCPAGPRRRLHDPARVRLRRPVDRRYRRRRPG